MGHPVLTHHPTISEQGTSYLTGHRMFSRMFPSC